MTVAGEFKNKAKQNAYDLLAQMFESYGLGELVPTIRDLVAHDYGSDTIALKLQETDAYKQRFAGNEARKKAGLPVLSPAQYLQQEASYRQALQMYGLPSGFYDQPSDFAAWIGNDVSPSEIQSRAAAASDAVTSANPEYRQALKDYYGLTDGDLVSYFLDQKRALPVLERQTRAAQIGGAALEQGLNVSAGRADQLAGYGIDQSTARQGYSSIAQALPTLDKLAGIDKTAYGQADAENAFLLDNADAITKTKKLASNERARFSGSSGIGQGSLSTKSKGQY